MTVSSSLLFSYVRYWSPGLSVRADDTGGKRRQAMKGVSAWLDARSKASPNGVLAELELRKLWRGLFFSMW